MSDPKKTDARRPFREREFAAALRYSPHDDSAPRMTAQGHGKLAEKIIRLAEEYGVPVRQDRDLVQILSRLDLNEEIPPAIYAAVAEILAFLYRASLEDGSPQRDRKTSPTGSGGD